MKLPANIDYWHTLETLPYLIASLPSEIQAAIGNVPSYVVDQTKGRAWYDRKNQEMHYYIPLWVLSKPREYQMWYLAHEVSHIMDYKTRGKSDHGPEFHAWLKKICPFESQKYEWEYMKRSQSRGVGQLDNIEDMI